IVLYGRQTAARGASPESSALFAASVKGGVAAEQVISHWIESCLKVGDLPGARKAVEVCGKGIGLAELGADWRWDEAIAKSDKLKTLHLNVYNMLDEALLAAGKADEADGVLRQVIGLHPTVSSPLLRLAQRHYDRAQWAEGDKLLTAFL